MADDQNVNVLIYVHPDYEIGKGATDPFNPTSSGGLERISLPLKSISDKIKEAAAVVDVVSDKIRGTKLHLDEIDITLEVESGGALGWVFGQAKGGLSFKFKVRE